MPAVLDGDAVRRWCALLGSSLERYRAALDALNVFPVPDRDTGTNVAATIAAAAERVARCADDGAGDVWAAMAGGAVLGAHGNSGVILAEWLRGSSTACAGMAECDTGAVIKALLQGCDAARGAVAEPVEGTILTVARAAADGAQDAGTSVTAALDAAVRAAEAALTGTRELLPALRAAGVVDAGGAALVITLSALRAAVADDNVDNGLGAEVLALTDVEAAFHAAARPLVEAPGAHLLVADGAGAATAVGYEVQFLLQASGDHVDAVRAELLSLGNSLVIAGDGAGKAAGDGAGESVGDGPGEVNVHIHTGDVSSVLAAAATAGVVRRVRVTELVAVSASADAAPGVALLAEATPGGGSDVLRGEGVGLVAPGPGDAWLSALNSMASMASAGGAAPGRAAVLFPITAGARAAAAQAASAVRSRGQQVAVIPINSVVQALAAVAVHDAHRRFDDDVIAMAEAAGATRSGSVSVSAHGAVRGLVGADVVSTGTDIGTDVATVAQAVVDRLLGAGGELVTVVGGVGAPLEAVAARLRRPGIEVATYVGGQLDPLLLLGVE